MDTELEKYCGELNLDLDKCITHSFSINTDFELDASHILAREVNTYCPINKTVINIIALGFNEIWFGVHKAGKLTTNYPNSAVEIEVPIDSPSKSYLKIAQIMKLFHVNFSEKDNWLDFGSAPGGASYYLLNKGCRVWGIDPAKMDEKVLENSRYHHITKALQDLSQEELPARDIEWIHVDLNLNPNQAIKEVLRLAKKYAGRLKGIIFTVQVVKNEYIQDIESFEDKFFDWGFTNVTSRHVPSHKNEYIIIAKR